MSIYYYLFKKSTSECLYLGKGGHQEILDFSGPAVLIDDKKYLLPKKYLKLVIDRIKDRSEAGDVVVVPDYKLFDCDEFLPLDEDVIEIGGERFSDVPMSKYLPELGLTEVLDEIASASLDPWDAGTM